MVYQVMHAGAVVGTSLLERRDPAMGMAFGVFVPAPAFEAVRGVFAIFDQAARAGVIDEEERLLTAYYQARDALGLALVIQEGVTVPTEWIHISAIEPDVYEVEAHITDPSFFGRERR
jgi:hypothetical protein